MKKGSLHRSTITFPKNFQHNSIWKPVEFHAPQGYFFGSHIWSDGKNMYYTWANNNHYVLNGNTFELETPVYNGSGFELHGKNIWTDGSNIFLSYPGYHYVLQNGVWKNVTRVGWASGEYIWSNGYTVFCSHAGDHVELGIGDWTTFVSWLTTRNWGIDETDGYWNGQHVWSDGTNVYLSYRTDTGYYKHYVLKSNKWEPKEWNFTNFAGLNVWTDGTNIYAGKSHVLKDGVWEPKEWKGLETSGAFLGDYVWSDGTNIYYSNYKTHYVLEPAAPVPQLNPAALMQGFATMLSLRRMRGVAPPADETDAVLEDGILYIKNASAVLKDGILEVK